MYSLVLYMLHLKTHYLFECKYSISLDILTGLQKIKSYKRKRTCVMVAQNQKLCSSITSKSLVSDDNLTQALFSLAVFVPFSL